MGPTPHAPALRARPCGRQLDTLSTCARSLLRTPCRAYIASRQRCLPGAAPVGRFFASKQRLERGSAQKKKDTHSGMCVRDETRSVCRRSMSSGTKSCLIRANSRARRSAAIIPSDDKPKKKQMMCWMGRTGRRLSLWHKPVRSQQLNYLLVRARHQAL